VSDLTVENKNKMNTGWLLPALTIIVVIAIAISALALTGVLGGTAPTGMTPETPQELWQSKGIDSYRFTLQVSCFCLMEMVQPVTVEVQNGEVASITYVADGSPANPEFFDRYSTIDKLFTIIEDADAQNAVRLDVTYEETYGVPLSIDIDISELMADEELYLTTSNFEPLP